MCARRERVFPREHTAIVTAEPDAADDVFLVAQDDDGRMVGETVYGSSLAAA
jgi:hypothetical protein